MLKRIRNGINAHRLKLRAQLASEIRVEIEEFFKRYNRIAPLMKESADASTAGDRMQVGELRWELVTTLESMRANIVKAGHLERRPLHDVGRIKLSECGAILRAHYVLLPPTIQSASRQFAVGDSKAHHASLLTAAESLDVMCATARVLGNIGPDERSPQDVIDEMYPG